MLTQRVNKGPSPRARPSVDAHAAPVLRALIEAVLGGVQRNDVVGARAAARALVTFLDGLPTPVAGDNVIKLAERRPTYGSQAAARCG